VNNHLPFLFFLFKSNSIEYSEISNMSETIQIIANISTTLALIVALIVFITQVRSDRAEREYRSFLMLLENYRRVVEERRKHWKTIREALKENRKVSHEVHEKQNSLSYLLIRINQEEPLYAVEHSLLEREISSLNFLDTLCEIALNNERALKVLILTDSPEISYYQNRLKDLLRIYESQKNIRMFPKPRYVFMQKMNVSDHFGFE